MAGRPVDLFDEDELLEYGYEEEELQHPDGHLYLLEEEVMDTTPPADVVLPTTTTEPVTPAAPTVAETPAPLPSVDVEVDPVPTDVQITPVTAASTLPQQPSSAASSSRESTKPVSPKVYSTEWYYAGHSVMSYLDKLAKLQRGQGVHVPCLVCDCYVRDAKALDHMRSRMILSLIHI